MELVRLAQQQGRILMVGHLLKYHPAFLKIQELNADPSFGKVEYIYSNRLSMGKIRREENALWSFAPHDVSLMLALMGQLPLQVTATGGAYLQPNIADVKVSHFLFDRGVRTHIFVSWLHPYKEHRLVIIGTRQMIVFEDTRADDKLILYDKNIEFKNGAFEAGKPNARPVGFAAGEPLRNECKHFIECVRYGREPRTPGVEGVEVLQVLQACQRSLQMNGEPVRVGNNVKVQNNVSIYTGCILEDDVFCGFSMVFTNVMNPRSHVVRRGEYRPTLVKRGLRWAPTAPSSVGT